VPSSVEHANVDEEAEEVSGVQQPTATVVDGILESMTDPVNRFYRYPAARSLMPVLGRITWLTPNHVTYLHTAFGLAAAALVAWTQSPLYLVVAFFCLEIRMVLDCFDGVLARATGKSSPFGRALDEIADTVAMITLTIATTYRLELGWRGVLLSCLMLGMGGLCANAWDFYKRKITTCLKDGQDRVLDEIAEKKALVAKGGGPALAYWGIYFDSFQVWLYDVKPEEGTDTVAVIRSRAHDPSFRRFAAMLAYLSFDNGLMILHIGLLTACLLQSQVVTLAYTTVLWTTAMVFARLVLRRPRRRTSES
jgi:hypothetical protein